MVMMLLRNWTLKKGKFTSLAVLLPVTSQQSKLQSATDNSKRPVNKVWKPRNKVKQKAKYNTKLMIIESYIFGP